MKALRQNKLIPNNMKRIAHSDSMVGFYEYVSVADSMVGFRFNGGEMNDTASAEYIFPRVNGGLDIKLIWSFYELLQKHGKIHE